MTTATRRKVTKPSVDYRPATGAHNCGNCVMFHPDGTCDLVKGRIDPDATCDKWYPRTKAPGLADAAVEAYLSGWALTDAPFTDRAHAGCLAAAGVALEHANDPGILEATLELGKLEGVWALVYQRRARLQRRHERAILAAWKACIAGLDPRDVVRAFRRSAYLPAEAVTKDPTKKWWQELAAAAALGWLRGVYHTDGYDALVAALAEAIREGMAEGEADALALAAAKQGRSGFSIAKAFKAAYDRLASDHTITQRAADAATALIDGAAGDVGRRLASLAGDGADEDGMTSGTEDVMDGQQAPQRGTDWTVWAAILAGAKALYSWLSGSRTSLPGTGPGDQGAPVPPGPDTPPGGPPQGAQVLLDWITAGDDRVCATCQGYEDNSPYAPEQVPDYPHPRCRCSVDLASDSGSSSLLAALLDSFTN